MKIAITGFGGVSSKVPARLLPDTGAQVAINGPMFNGTLQGLPNVGNSLLTLTKPGTPLSIYRYGMDLSNPAQYWFSWLTDVDVVRGPIYGDPSETTFFTTADASFPPQLTYNALALTGSGSNYPLASYALGVPVPVVAPSVTTTGTPATGAVPETWVYVYTYIAQLPTGWIEESAPSPPSALLSVSTGQTAELYNFANIPSGYAGVPITGINIYRSVTGTYQFVTTLSLTAALAYSVSSPWQDTFSAAQLGEALPSLTWLPPPSDLIGLVSMPNGILCGFRKNSSRDVYLSDPYHPHAWPVANINTVDYPVVGLGVMDTTLAVLTSGRPFFIQGSDPANMVQVESDIRQACVSKRSIVSANGVVYYASPDGLVMLSSNGSQILTLNQFNRAQWQALNPASITANFFDNKYIAFFSGGSGFIYDTVTNGFMMHSLSATAAYNDLENEILYLGFADKTIKTWAGGSDTLPFTWKSKKFTMTQFTGFSCARVQAEGYPVTLQIYADGNLILTQTVTGKDPFRLPAIPARDWEVQLQGGYEVYSVVLAQSMQEMAGD